MGLGIGIEDYGLRYGIMIRIRDLNLGLGIRIGDWGLGIENWDWD